MCRNRARLTILAILAITFSSLVVAANAAERLRTFWRGQWVDYVEIGDVAITEGDIIIGSIEAARQWAKSAEQNVEPSAGSQDRRKALTVDAASWLWLRAASGVVEVPYTIEAGNSTMINAAVTEVNRLLSGVLQWVPRTSQADYVAFNLTARDSGACSSSVGRVGGRQQIRGEPDCGVTSFIHEMGHAIGLLHVQQDADANSFVNIRLDRMAPSKRFNNTTEFNTRTFDGYDYGSLMHYGGTDFQAAPGAITIETRPPGIDLDFAETYSAADVDAILRLYDKPSSRTTVTSNPVGLQVIVDGVMVTTPASFNWPINTVHRVWASNALQTKDGFKFAFGRWSHDANATPSLQYTWQGSPGDAQLGSPASVPSSTVITANFVRLVDVAFSPTTQAGGTVSIVPRAAPWPSTTSLYPQLTTFDLIATPAAGYQNYGTYSSFVTPFNGGMGLRPNVSMLVPGYSPSITIGESFHNGPAIGVDAVGDGILDLISVEITAPGAAVTTLFAPRLSRTTPGIWKFVMPSPQYIGTSIRHVFDGYAGFDNSVTGEVAMPSSGVRNVTIKAHRELAPYTEVVPACAGAISLSNSSGWVRFGSSLGATVAPGTSAIFVGWTGTASGTSTTVTTTVGTAIPEFVATFNSVAEPLGLTSLSRKLIGDDASATTVVTLNGTGFSPSSQVFLWVSDDIGGVPMSTTFVDSHTLRIAAGRDQFPAAGRLGLYVRNGLSSSCFARSSKVAVDVLPIGKSVGLKLTEYYHAGLDYYFLTGRAADKAALDAFPAIWARTGNEINMYSLPTTDTLPFERHYFDKVARGGSRGSHFFTALPSDQAAMTSLNPSNAPVAAKPYLEGVEGYAIPKGAGGTCPSGTTPIYRAFKGAPRYVDDGNHRFSTSLAQHQDMVNRLGWTDEGIVFCGVQ